MNIQVKARTSVEDCKDFHQALGFAFAWAHCFEFTVRELVVTMKWENTQAKTATTIDTIYQSIDRHTLGQLIGSARHEFKFRPTDDQMLGDLLDVRNRLIHRYLSEKQNAARILTEKGRKKLTRELWEMGSRFESGTSHVNKILFPVWEKYGLTQKAVDNAIDTAIQKEMAK